MHIKKLNPWFYGISFVLDAVQTCDVNGIIPLLMMAQTMIVRLSLQANIKKEVITTRKCWRAITSSALMVFNKRYKSVVFTKQLSLFLINVLV